MSDFGLLNLGQGDFDMILEGLEALKSKDLSSELMFGLLEAAFEKPNKELTVSEIEEKNLRKLKREEEKKQKEEERKVLVKNIDLLKAKLTLMQDSLTKHSLRGEV